MIVKARFIKNGFAFGKAYSYIAPNDGEEYKVGDYIYLNKDSIGVIAEVDVPEDKVGFPIDKLRTFTGRAESPETAANTDTKDPKTADTKGE